MNNRKLFNDIDELESSMFNYINLRKNNSNQFDISNKNDDQIKDYNLEVTVKDYYFSNVIARASKTMHECNNSKLEKKLTGTDS